MRLLLVRSAVLECAHHGRVNVEHSQDFVRIAGDFVLVDDDLVGRSISACPNASLTTSPCLSTIAVDETPTYSSFVRIDGRRVCKKSAVGRTDWSKFGITPFHVVDAGQVF